MIRMTSAACGLAALLACAGVWAQQKSTAAYPEKPIRVIVPFAPGGATDVPARLLAPKLQEALGQPIVIENRTGAGGIIGIQAAVTSAPDGYTLLMATNAELVMHPYIYAKLPYDPAKDLTPVSIMIESPLVLLTAASSPLNSVADFIAAAKAKPDTLTYSTAGTGLPVPGEVTVACRSMRTLPVSRPRTCWTTVSGLRTTRSPRVVGWARSWAP